MNLDDLFAATPETPAGGLYHIAGPGGKKALAMDFAAVAPTLDGRSARFRITSQDMDREGDIVLTGGLDWSLFKSNPDVLLMHDGQVVVGTGKGPDGQVALDVKDGEAFGTVYFQGDAADEAIGLVKKGILTGASIGFLPLKARPRVPGEPKKGYVIEKAAVFEWSICGTPACPTCVRVEGEKLKTLKKALSGCACGCDECKGKTSVAGLDLAELFFPVDKFDLEKANAKLAEVVKSVAGPTPATINEAGVRYRLIDPAKLDPAAAAVEQTREGVIHVYRKALATKPAAPPELPVTKALLTAEDERAGLMDMLAQGMATDLGWPEIFGRVKSMVADVHEGMSEHSGHENLTHTQRTAVKSYCGGLGKAMKGMDYLLKHGPKEHMGQPVTKTEPAVPPAAPPTPPVAPTPVGPPAATPTELAELRAAMTTFEQTRTRVLGI